MNWKSLLLILSLAIAGPQPLSAQAQPGTQLWTFTAPYTAVSCPAVAPDGTIYLGTAAELYAITNAGSNKWTFAASLKGSPAVGSDGTIYFGDLYTGAFYALNADGSQQWTFPAQGKIWSSPAIGFDGTIYFTAQGQLIALSSAGAKKWQFQIDGSSQPNQSVSPVIAKDGTIYVGSYYARTLYAINPDGTEQWRVGLGAASSDSPAIAANGTIYVTGLGLYAFTKEGTNLWSTTTNRFSGASPAIGPDGTIYVESDSSSDPGIHAFKPTGEVMWYAGPSAGAYGYPTTSPVIDGSGILYFCEASQVFAISPQGTTNWVFNGIGSLPPPYGISPAIGPDGTIYAAIGPRLYALAGTNALADSAWPMYRQNLRHTGKIEKPSLQQPKKRADAGFQLQIMNQLGSTNLIQTSLDLAAWSPLTNVTVTNVPMDFVDWDASNFPARFYRAVQQQ